MKYNIYGRFVLEVVREHGRWVAYRVGTGLKRLENNLVIPSTLKASELPSYLDDVYHEMAQPGQEIVALDATSE